MESIAQPVLNRYRQDPSVIGVSIVPNPEPFSPDLDGFDYLALVIRRMPHDPSSISHYIEDRIRIQERRIDPDTLEQWILHGENRNVVHWILQGEIVMDRYLYLEGLRHKLLEFPTELRRQKLLVEFARFLKKYLSSKKFLQDGHLLDAYANVLEALHHWARIAIIEEGIHPETFVWAQVRKINPGVYKLYEELTSNNETLEQRVQLVLLACEFSVMSKMESCCSMLLDVLRSREEAWSLQELMRIPELRELNMELPLLLRKLVRKSLIREVIVSVDDSLLMELRYTI